MKKLLGLLAVAAVAPLLAACSGAGSGSSSDTSGAARVVERYLQAVVTADVNAIANLVCAAWEESAQIEAESFQSVTARLDGVTCEATGTDGAATVVSCKGNIVATYENEDQNISVADRPYLAVQEAGEWRMCGYKP
jgi:hypothetical protein